jgi:hypothetical protein
MITKETVRENFSKDLEAISHDKILSPGFIRKKLIFWLIRTVITIVLYIIFWKYSWVRWTLILTVPLNLLGLFAIVGAPYLIKRRMERMKQSVRAANIDFDESENGKQ